MDPCNPEFFSTASITAVAVNTMLAIWAFRFFTDGKAESTTLKPDD